MSLPGYFRWIGHRGASGHEPENTLLSVEKAIEMGLDWIEIDIQYCDGELFVFHDEFLERTTNGTGRFKEKTKNYLRSLDAGKGTRIPFLKEVLERAEKRINIIIEIKDDEAVLPLIHLLGKFLNSGRMTGDNLIVSSFNPEHIKIFRSLENRIPIAVITDTCDEEILKITKKLGCESIHVNFSSVSDVFIRNAHQLNLNVFVFTVNTLEEMQILVRMDADGVFTDYPELRNSLSSFN